MDSIGRKGGRGPRASGLWRLKHAVLGATHTTFGRLPGAQSSPTAGPLERNFRAEGALSYGCITTDYSPMILECPRDAHRGCSERYPDTRSTWKVAQNRHGPAIYIVLHRQGAVDRGARAYGGPNACFLTPARPVLGLPDASQTKNLKF